MTPPASHLDALKAIRALVMDVDGVLTDGGLWLGPNNAEWKRFSFSDIMGLSLARRAGLELGLISGEDSELVDRFAQKMNILHVVKGCRDKAQALKELSAKMNLPLAAICFAGDDVNDLPAMRLAGFCVAPSNAASDVLAYAQFIAEHTGGNGAIREWVETWLAARGQTAATVYDTRTRHS